LFRKFKERICDLNFELGVIYEIEKLILNRISWKITLSTAVETQLLIIKEFVKENTIFQQIFDVCTDWVNFSLTEWDIYRNFSQFTIALSCLLISLKIKEMTPLFTEISVFIKEKYDFQEIQECMNRIAQIMFDEEDDESIQQKQELMIFPICQNINSSNNIAEGLPAQTNPNRFLQKKRKIIKKKVKNNQNNRKKLLNEDKTKIVLLTK
jgi:hypothetical protein